MKNLRQTKQVIANLEKLVSEKLGEDITILSVTGCDCKLKDGRLYCLNQNKLVDKNCYLSEVN